jgi:hypothetical protein
MPSAFDDLVSVRNDEVLEQMTPTIAASLLAGKLGSALAVSKLRTKHETQCICSVRMRAQQRTINDNTGHLPRGLGVGTTSLSDNYATLA